MSAEELEQNGPAAGGGRRKRRRRRRGRRKDTDGAAVEAAAHAGSGGGNKRRKKSRPRDPKGPAVTLPRTGLVPRQRLAIHPNRGKVASGAARRRRLSRAEMDNLAAYLARLSDQLVANLYSGMGGQPSRVSSKDRMIQLCVRAIAQGNRLGNLIKTLHQRDRQALAILVQCGGLAHHEEFKAELMLSLGGNDREWTKVMSNLSSKGLVAASDERDGHYFFIVPDPLVDHLLEHLHEDLVLPSFEPDSTSGEVKIIGERPFSPPLDFSMVSLSTYIDQHPPRLTQRQDIFKVHKDEMDQFFSQLWDPDSELFNFHVEFLMVHGMVELRGDRLSVNRAVIEEWLQLDPEDQHDLIFSSLARRFPLAEWILWAIHDVGGAWVPERPLQALYRRWRRGEDWRERFHKDQWASPKTAQREGFSFTPLVNTGVIELGQWGQEKFFRVSPRGKRLLVEQEEEGFAQFYLTPSFEIMAPAGMAPVLFFRIGELAELTACDRANTYKITEVTIEQALEKGWRRDDILDFLRENSQIGLPENVEQTLRGWMGHHGDVEYHDVMLLTVHRSQIRRLESNRQVKPFLLHRFVPGMYGVDRTRMDELNAILSENGFSPAPRVRLYPDDPQQVDARSRLLEMVIGARELRQDLVERTHAADSLPEHLAPVPGSAVARQRKRKRDELPPRRSPREVRELAERAIARSKNLDILYVSRDQTRTLVRVQPERVATAHSGQQVLVARDVKKDERLSYQLLQIERAEIVRR